MPKMLTTDIEKLDEFIFEVGREVGIRQRFYPKWVKEKQMTDVQASRWLGTMNDLYYFLKKLREQASDSQS